MSRHGTKYFYISNNVFIIIPIFYENDKSSSNKYLISFFR